MKFRLNEGLITEANVNGLQKMFKKTVLQWMNKYNGFYDFWREPQFSDALSTSFGVIIYPKDYEKAKVAENAIQEYFNDLGYSTWGKGAERTNPGVVTFHINYGNNRPKSNAYTYGYGYKYEDLEVEENLIDDIKRKRLKNSIKVIKNEPDVLSWKDINDANKQSEKRKLKDWKQNGSNMTYDDYRRINKGL